MSEALLEARGLTRTFGRLRAVDGLDFAMESGRIVGFIGPNGAGKTTTMRMLATLELPDGGDAFVEGRSVLVEPRYVRDRIGFMPDRFEPYPNLDVMQYLDFFARAQGLRGGARLRAVRSVASFCGLHTFATRPATGLSKGMGQRLHLAKTLLHDPALLILDEPASGLDPRARVEFRALLRELAAAGKGILISSHILTELSETCDDVLVIEQGRLVVSGAIADVARRSREEHRFAMRALDDVATVERFLLTQPGVREVRTIDTRAEFVLDGGDEAAAALLQRAVAQGLRVAEFFSEELDLEDIFMRATQGRLQ